MRALSSMGGQRLVMHGDLTCDQLRDALMLHVTRRDCALTEIGLHVMLLCVVTVGVVPHLKLRPRQRRDFRFRLRRDVRIHLA